MGKGKKISVVIPTYNEESNIRPMCDAIENLFTGGLSLYELEILIIDNCSKDSTEKIIEDICREKPFVKAIFNTRNFGPFGSPVYGMCQAAGDAVVLITADFQEPVDLIETFVNEWENDEELLIVCGIRVKSHENKVKYAFRQLYYKLMNDLSDIEQIRNFTGFGLYDRKVINAIKKQNDPLPFIRGMVTDYGFRRKEIEYVQSKRRSGKSSFNLYRYYDAVMLGFTAYTKVGMRFATFIGFFSTILSLLIAFIYLILKILYWDSFGGGTATVLIGVYLLGSVQLFFMGILGEYILSMNTRIRNMPFVIERRRINFDEDDGGKFK